MKLESLRFPIGRFNPDSNRSIKQCIETIESFPFSISSEVISLSEKELGFRYRPEGWTIYQLVNHCGDSHMNALIRFKLTLTEDTPTIKPYKEGLWAELSDSEEFSIHYSLSILEGVHKRWAIILNNMHEKQFDRNYFHPEDGIAYPLRLALKLYDWHCHHHLEHIKLAKTAKGKWL